MNYLAHLYLAEHDPKSLIGSLMGDFIRGPLDASLEPLIRQGIWLHRKVDAFTDAHGIVKRSKRRLAPHLRRYAGILIDVFYDHFLASQWMRYSTIPLREFSDSVYQALAAHYDHLPPAMQRSAFYMISNDLLMSYRDLAGIGRSLQGIERRLRRESQLAKGIVDLERHYEHLAMDFALFFPELIVYAQRQKRPFATER